jgi:uncharacterized protein YjeT (DUF2065 family)
LVLVLEPVLALGLVPELARVRELGLVLVLELVLGLVPELARELVPELARVREPGLVLALEPGLARVRELGLVLALEPGLARVLAAQEEELGVEAVDCSALVGAILNIHPHSMVKKVALVFKLRWMKTAMWMMQKLQEKEAAAAKSMKMR